MQQNNKKIKMITHAAVLAATLVVSRLIVITFLKSGSPIGRVIGAPKELQFYAIPATTLYLVSKFGKKYGWYTALAGTMIGVSIAGITGSFSYYVSPWSISFDYFIPWAICTLIAFVPKENMIMQIVYSFIIWTLVMMSWAVSGVMAWGVMPYTTALKWGIVTFNGWMMWIILPIFTLLLTLKFNKK